MTSFLTLWRENDAIDLWIGRWNADYDDPDNFTTPSSIPPAARCATTSRR
jgi:hypothetical protein